MNTQLTPEELDNKAILGDDTGDVINNNPNYKTYIKQNKLKNSFKDSFQINGGTTIDNSSSGITSVVGWTTDIKFTATDNNTVSWSDGNIYYPDGKSYNILTGNTGDMTTTTYIYLDEKTSSLTITTTPEDSVGKRKLLVCVTNPVNDTTKKAEFQAFGTDQHSKMITGDVIAGNTILGNSIVANSLKATEIDTSTITITALGSDNYKNGAGYGYNGLNSDGYVKKIIDGTVINSSPTPTKNGLYLTTSYMGFWSQDDTEWKSYIDNSGNFKFKGNVDNYITWDGSDLNIHGNIVAGKGSSVTWSYIDGTGKPADNADVTGDNTAKDTAMVSGTASLTVKNGAVKANTGLNNSGRYRLYLDSKELGKKVLTSEYTGVIVDNNGIRMYMYKGARADGTKYKYGEVVKDSNGNDDHYWRSKISDNQGHKPKDNSTDWKDLGPTSDGVNYNSYLLDNGDAFFMGTLGASTIESDGYIDLINGKKEIKLDLSGGDPAIRFWDNDNNTKTDCGYIHGHSATVNVGGTNFDIQGIYMTKDIGTAGNCYIEYDLYVGGGVLIDKELNVYGKLQIPVGTDLYDKTT